MILHSCKRNSVPLASMEGTRTQLQCFGSRCMFVPVLKLAFRVSFWEVITFRHHDLFVRLFGIWSD